MYKLRFLPGANTDLQGISDYISLKLHAPQASLDLLNELEHALESICEYPYSRKVYQAVNKLEFEYRMLAVKNYLVFYIVLEPEKTVEVHRIIYGRRDIPNSVNMK